MSKRRRAGAGRRIAEQRFWDGGSGTGGPPAHPSTPAPVTHTLSPTGPGPTDPGPADPGPADPGPDGQSPDGQSPDGQRSPDGQSPDGQSPVGQTPGGQRAVSQSAGGHEPSPSPVEPIRPTTDPAAVVRSLGTPPFSIDASVAERHLTAVYEEAVRAATALAAANGLLAGTEDDPDR